MAGNTACPEKPDIIKPKAKGMLYISAGMISVSYKKKKAEKKNRSGLHIMAIKLSKYALAIESRRLPGFVFLESPS